MKFSLFVQPAWPQNDPSHQSRVFAEAVEQIQYAMDFGTLTHEQTMGSMELFAKEVMPKFR